MACSTFNCFTLININNNKALRSLRDFCIIDLLFSTGMRIGELAALNLEDIRFQERTIKIFGKGRKERAIYVSSDETCELLRMYLSVRRPVSDPKCPLFLNKNGSRLSIYSIENIFSKYCRKGRIKNHYTPHCLRHTMATMMLDNGANIRVVQEILGHSSIVTTQIYTEVSLGKKRQELNRFSQRNRFTIF